MSTNLKLIEHTTSADHYQLLQRSLANDLISTWLDCNIDLGQQTADCFALNLAGYKAIAFIGEDSCFALQLSNQNYFDKITYFKALHRLTKHVLLKTGQLKLVNPCAVAQSDLISYEIIGSEQEHLMSSGKNTVSLIGQISSSLLLSCYGELQEQTLSIIAKERECLKLIVGIKTLTDTKPSSLWLQNKNDYFNINIKHKAGGIVMSIDSEEQSAELDKVPLKIVLGELTVSLADFVRFKTGAVLEFECEQSLTGYLELDDGARVAAVTLECDGDIRRLRVEQLLLE